MDVMRKALLKLAHESAEQGVRALEQDMPHMAKERFLNAVQNIDLAIEGEAEPAQPKSLPPAIDV